jgi:ribosomal-protein-alanine N-acetyltransferase
MSESSTVPVSPVWRTALPTLSGRSVTLREPTDGDTAAIVDLLSLRDATRFGIEDAVTEASVRAFVARTIDDRTHGRAFAYLVTRDANGAAIGLFLVRGLDLAFEAGEWECTLAPSARGTGVFVEAARLVAAFTFTRVGAYRLEARVLLQNGRGNGALRKLGAVQEGVLRHSVRRDDRYFDQVLWSILRDDWADQRLPLAPRVH